jgi:hypothetical protein
MSLQKAKGPVTLPGAGPFERLYAVVYTGGPHRAVDMPIHMGAPMKAMVRVAENMRTAL